MILLKHIKFKVKGIVSRDFLRLYFMIQPHPDPYCMGEKFPGVTTLVTTENRRHICQDGIFKDISYDFLEIIQGCARKAMPYNRTHLGP